MSHKADKSFFDQKKPWSRRKDTILSYYLTPYLAKVKRLGRPILLVDGFAGPGKFDDGELGSPLIMAEKAQSVRDAQIEVLCIEQNKLLFQQLHANLAEFGNCTVLEGDFASHASQIFSRARKATTFLYLDPWTVNSIDWPMLDFAVEQLLRSGSSVELLMNFNTPHFVRWALSMLHRAAPPRDEGDTDDPLDASPEEAPPTEKLSSIVGGHWWSSVLDESEDFAQQVRLVAGKLQSQLAARFGESAKLAILERLTHRIPKYHLLFASRHPDAIELMNDAMVEARGNSDFEIDLFACKDIDRLLFSFAGDWIKRGELILAIIRRRCGEYRRKEIRGRIEDQIRSGHLETKSGKKRINDEEHVRAVGNQQS